MIHAERLSIADELAQGRSRRRTAAALLSGLALVLGLIAAELAVAGHLLALAFILALAFPVVMWRRPDLGFASLLLATALIEQFPISQFPMTGQPAQILTDQIPLFISLSTAYSISGVMVSPIEMALVVTALIWLMKGVLYRQLALPRSGLARAVGIYAALVVIGVVWGLAHGANYREVIDEVRPFLYLIVLFVLVSQMLDASGAIGAILWALVIGTGLKGIEGTLRFMLLRSAVPRPESLLSHEEAVFFSLFILLCAALWLFKQEGRLRTTSTVLLPFVVIADLGNGRRAAWLILIAGLLVLAVVGWLRLPDRRRPIAAVAVACGVLGSIYLAFFWNGNGGLAQPARAIRSALSPSTRDNASDLYRVQEDANLALNIKLTTPLGAGFGIPIDYALPITDLTKTTPSLAYVPHNTILYIWMRLGFPGIIAFWCLVGIAIVMACRLIRSPDDRLALFGLFAACAVIAYVIEGYYDLGLSWYRLAVLMGCVLGALQALLAGARRVAIAW